MALYKTESLCIQHLQYLFTMRLQTLQHVFNVLLIGLFRRHYQAYGFGFGFAPAPSVPLQVAANNPFPSSFPGPFPFAPSPCGAAAFCPPPTVVLAPSFAVPFFPPPYPPLYPPPYPPPLPPPYPHGFGLFSSLLQAILAKKGKLLPPPPYPYPPSPPAHYHAQHPQEHILKVHVTKDSEHDYKKHHHHNHHNHWHDEKLKWN